MRQSYTQCKAPGCDQLTIKGNYCCKHNRMVDTCSHSYYMEMSIPVEFCSLTGERAKCKCENYYPFKRVWESGIEHKKEN